MLRAIYLLILLSTIAITLINAISHKPPAPEDFESDDDEIDIPTTKYVPNSCLNQPDSASTVIKPMKGQSYPTLNAGCSNEYMIINLKQDQGWNSYFSSLREYHYNLIGPEKDDHANWDEWFLPPMENFIVSPDCATCDETHELNQLYSTASGYYMTPVTNGCTQLPIGRIGCDMDWHSYACRVCESAQTREPGYWHSYEVYNGLNDPETTLHFTNEIEEQSFAKYGLCGFTIRDAKATHDPSLDTYEHCKTVTHEDVEGEQIMPRRKPSIGQDGRFCVCAKPKAENYKEFEIPLELYEEKMAEESEKRVSDHSKAELAEKEHLNERGGEAFIALYQKDFEDGTYRITQPGKYVIMEDIVFDFKAPVGYKAGDLDTYNGPDAWWPTVDDADEYDGAGGLKGSYMFGFWAGITIECADVILELNHHTLEMSEAFYYQQSFFAIISLTSQVFLPGQGPGFFGANPQSAQNVMIRNGELGLTSHHGIQGNFNKNVLIENMKIHNFKTHGIQFNGFDGITIRNTDVGPNRKVDALTPYYAHMKALLPVYRQMYENEDVVKDTCIHFEGMYHHNDKHNDDEDCVFMKELIDDVQTSLDMAFEYVIFDKNWDEIDVGEYKDNVQMQRKLRLWQENRKILINDHHSAQTATLYGIFLNYIGSNVIGWYAGSETTKSHNVHMDNVKIHDLHHDTYENIAFSQGEATASQRILNCLNAPFNAYHIFGKDQVDLISECNNYIIENGKSKKCKEFRENGLEYAGNTIVDIQIMSFELINRYGLSWNYCSAGAADMAALADFALRGTQFVDQTPLLVGSHDPMIHPGKGVMGLRFNGVDGVDMKDVKISNIHSQTQLGSMLGGTYEDVVSQQAPYMNGYSMNMVNGMSLTFTTNVNIQNTEINKVISNTGLAYGVAAWYETHINVMGRKGLEIKHVHAGWQLAPSSAYRSDSYPNLKPEGCAFRIYDDVIYKTVVDFSDNARKEDNIVIECVSGHTGCLNDKSTYSSIGTVAECADVDNMFATTEDATISEQVLGIESEQRHSTHSKKGKKGKKKRMDDRLVNILIGAAVILSVCATLFYYFGLSSIITRKKLISTNEETPLLNEVGLATSYH